MNWGSSYSYPYISQYCNVATGLLTNENFEYQLRSTDTVPNRGTTSGIGSSQSISIDIMQPTLFSANLFIYSQVNSDRKLINHRCKIMSPLFIIASTIFI